MLPDPSAQPWEPRLSRTRQDDRVTRVVVVGSLNSDVVVQVPRLPLPGETLLGDRVDRYPGGKGLNQAVAAARLGSPVTMVGCLARDAAGDELLDVLRSEGITAAITRVDDGSSGTALIEVAGDGENRIVVVPGSNARLDAGEVSRAVTHAYPVAVVLAQAEIPAAAVAAAMRAGRSAGATTVLNASPAQEPAPGLLADVDVVVVNEHEAALLTGVDASTRTEAGAAARALVLLGPATAVVTLGGNGVVWADSTGRGGVQAAYAVDPVDTVGAGDAFCGALAEGLARGLGLEVAVRRAAAAGALATTRAGAVPSLPSAAAVDALVDGT
jgi:ribokinase